MIRKAIMWLVAAMVLLAIWRGTGGSLDNIFQSIWHVIETGADIVTRAWHAIVPIAQDAAGNGASTPAPSGTPAP